MRMRHTTYSLMMAGIMTGTVSAVVTAINIGFDKAYASAWLHAWSIAFPVGFLVLVVASPVVRRLNDVFYARHKDSPPAS